MEKKLFLLDGHALVYRAHYAFINRPLINSKGINTSAITGFVRTLWDILVKEKPTHLAVAFDPSGGTIRHDYFPEYKANREQTPEDIKIALPIIKEIVEAFNIPVVSIPTFEADDAIGTLAKQAEKEGFTVFMVTPDKDYAQLVSENIFMYKPSRQGNGIDILGVPEVLEKWNIQNVNQVIDILGLQGDSVDNIPGVPGIGPKTAQKLLAKFDSVEGILANTDQLKGKQKENLETYAEQAMVSKKLATILLDVPCQFDADKYIIEPYNREALEKLFVELEFRSLAQQVLGQSVESAMQSPQTGATGKIIKNDGPIQGDLFSGYGNVQTDASKAEEYSVAKKSITDVEHDYQIIDSPEGRKTLINNLLKQSKLSFDTETTSIDANEAELVGLVFSYEKGKAFYIPIPKDNAEAKAICAEFKPVLENENIILVGQNIKYDGLMMKWYDVNLVGPYFDTMIGHYLVEPDMRHKLDYLSESYLDYKMIPITDLLGKGAKQRTMREVPVDKAAEYAGEDADITLQVEKVISEKLDEKEVVKIFNEIELPLIDVLRDMEYEGIKLDSEYLKSYSVELATQLQAIEKSIYDQAGVQFNIASPRQVGEVLFEKMKIPYRWKKTKSGQYSTDVEKLTELSKDHDIVNTILEYRKLAKLKSTYVDALPLMVNEKTGRIHSNFNQARAATGRLSSDNPNLQNIPIRDEAGRKIREAFIPRDEDHILLAADYSQIELRLIAEISGDEGMLEAFINGNDFHRATAAKVFATPYEEVTSDQRRMAKTVNFSITYGAGSTNLSKQLDIPRTEAKTLIENYFTQFPGLKQYMDKTVEFAREKGYVETQLGRKRELRDINSRSGLMRSNAERMAINTPIQGTAADMIKIAMINIHKKMKAEGYTSKMILQVHDELVFDVYKPELEKLKALVEHEMKTAIPNLKVPILIGMDIGENWLEAH